MAKLDYDKTRTFIRAEQDGPPFTYHGEPIEKIAVQYNPRVDPKPTEFVYVIKKLSMILYNSNENSNFFTKMGLEVRTSTAEGRQLLMKECFEKFVTEDKKWLDQRHYTMLVEGKSLKTEQTVKKEENNPENKSKSDK